jgi:amino acid adenylation domain-containing protein
MQAYDDEYPLSPLQQGLLLNALFSPGGGVDVIQVICTLREAVDGECLRRAWEHAVAAHPVLRTEFAWEGVAEPVQRVRAAVELPWAVHDWSGLPPVEAETRFATLLAEDRERGFDLSAAPLTRCTLVRLGAVEHQLVWTWHHAILDGRSYPRVLRDAFGAYEELREGGTPDIRPATPFRDYVHWTHGREAPGAAEHWRALLEGYRAPASRPASPEATEAGSGEHTIRLSPARLAALEAAARRYGVTLNTMVQGAWALLLGNYDAVEDVVFGAVRGGRKGTVPGADDIVGPVINTLPVRVRMSRDVRTGEWLAALRAQHLAVRPFEHTPLPRVREWAEIPGEQPLFETLVVYEGHLNDTVLRAQGGSWLRRGFRVRRRPHAALCLAAFRDAGLILTLTWDRARHGDAEARGMAGHLRVLLHGLAAPEDRPLSRIPLLSRAERRRVVGEWNRTDAPADAPCMLQRFLEHARARPDALAVGSEREALTYGELDTRAARLAHGLRRRGVGPEVRVALLLDRSPELIVAILAVLKAGGAYVPLDPAYPPERLTWLLRNCGTAVLLTRGALSARVPEGAPVEILALDAPLDPPEAGSTPDAAVGPHGLAYVIYTSGSTGLPKGVMAHHGGLDNLVAWHQRAYRLRAGDRVSLIASPSFDASVWEIWPALACGASLHVPPEEVRIDPPALLGWLVRERLTIAFLPTAAAEEFVAHAAAAGPDATRGLALRTLITGGDRLRGVPKGLPFTFYNNYGPTENTVISTWALADPAQSGPPPIGRPLPNTRAYVLDRYLRPVPAGMQGELYLGGAQVTRGYLDRPRLTAERFVPDPFSVVPGARLYRSGDRARWDDAGRIHFLGRTDFQVKVRGFRVELGEVEATLARHPAVHEAVVVAPDDAEQGRRLVAYCVPAGAEAPADAALRAFLGERLPPWMIPATFVTVDRLPFTPAGKLNREALPAPAPTACPVETYVAPGTPVERALADVWRDVLRVERPGVHDSFFALGGHSLLAARLASRTASRLGVALTARAVFDAPTIAELARVIEAGRTAAAPELLAECLDQLETLSDEQVLAMLGQAEALEGAGGVQLVQPV